LKNIEAGNPPTTEEFLQPRKIAAGAMRAIAAL
jgi:hypothetical protein